tara:strand:+ start:600 stop:785 length:186 start_codon:yes stop_codon:yes gene_type:complete
MAEMAEAEAKKVEKKVAPKPKAAPATSGGILIPKGVDTSDWKAHGFKSESAYKWYLHKFAT